MFHRFHEISSQLDCFMCVGLMIRSYKIVSKIRCFVGIFQSDATNTRVWVQIITKTTDLKWLLTKNFLNELFSWILRVREIAIRTPLKWKLKSNHNKCFYLYNSRLFHVFIYNILFPHRKQKKSTSSSYFSVFSYRNKMKN